MRASRSQSEPESRVVDIGPNQCNARISLNEIIAKGATEGEAGSSSDRPRR